MIDLHLHFDGSLPVQTVLRLAKKPGDCASCFFRRRAASFLEAPADCRDLNEYLERFDLPLQVLQTREALQEAMKDLVCELASEGLVYAEIRFAPQLHTSRGFNQRQVVEAVLEGMNEGLKENPSLLDAGTDFVLHERIG